MNKELIKAAWVRAYRSFFQALVAQIPAGFVITPAMIQYFKVSYLYVLIAIVANAALYALASFATCIVGGLPEVEMQGLLEAEMYEEVHDEEGGEENGTTLD